MAAHKFLDPKQPDELLTLEEVAEILKLTHWTVAKKGWRTKVGLEPICFRIDGIRILKSDFSAWLDRKRTIALGTATNHNGKLSTKKEV